MVDNKGKMVYLRWGQTLPSGNSSESFVFGSPDSLVNMGKGNVPYEEIRNWFGNLTDLEFKGELGKRLKLKGEELEVVCERLFCERDKGEWREPFEFEK